MAGSTQLALQYPVGSSNEALRAALVRLVDVLRSSQNDAAQETAIQALQTGLAALSTKVDNIVITGGGLTDQDRLEIAIDHLVDTIQGTRSEWQVYIEDQFRKLADSVLQVNKWQQDDTAAIITEQTVRRTESDAVASQITTIVADVASANAANVAEQTARANGDAANALSISTLSTTVGGNTTSINSLTTSVNGISAQWGVSISTNGNVIGAATLSGSQNVTSFNVVAGRFGFALSDNGAVTPFFTAGNVNGTPTSVFTGTLIGDGTIIGRHILAGQVTAAKIAAGAVTADKMSVTSLSALSANLGTVTAGLIRDSADTVRFDLPNMRLYRPDGKFQLDMANMILEFIA